MSLIWSLLDQHEVAKETLARLITPWLLGSWGEMRMAAILAYAGQEMGSVVATEILVPALKSKRRTTHCGWGSC